MPSIVNLLRYWNTLRYLKPIQVAGRVRFRFKPALEEFGLPLMRREMIGQWQRPIVRPVSLISEAQFSLLGMEYALPQTDGWDDERIDKLRRYNLHYFDDLTAPEGREAGRWHGAWITRWILENPLRIGTGWEPYPTSLRIVNWIKWALAGNVTPDGFERSLALQARWLSRRLEWHLLGNHLFANAKALLFAGLFFVGREADVWRAKALRILRREFPEQLLADGGHFELSPMYHAIFLEDVLDILNACLLWPADVPAYAVKSWRDALPRMLAYLSAMTHPDGEVGFFNDSAIGIAPSVTALAAYAARLDITAPPPASKPVHLFHDSGYARVTAGPAVALLDMARVGPDYLPGHAHADTLSFELSLGANRLIVNGGTSEYGISPKRLFERSTAAHSTVMVDGEDSSEVWSSFRVARRARPIVRKISVDPSVEIHAAHDGYRRLPGKPIHHRFWRFSATGLVVEDRIDGQHGKAVGRFILAPNIMVVEREPGIFELSLKQILAEFHVHIGQACLADSWYSPRFGQRVATRSIEVTLRTGRSRVELSWR